VHFRAQLHTHLSGAQNWSTSPTQTLSHATLQQNESWRHTLLTQPWTPSQPGVIGETDVWHKDFPQAPFVGVWQHFPLVHGVVPGQTLPQVPQLFLSVCLLTHPPPQQSGVVPEQEFPQDPQFCGSVCVREQLPLQHSRPPAHALPQLPQFAVSDCVSTQRPPHACAEPLHESVQVPVTHVQVPPPPASEPHALPHAPQFRASLFVSTQASPHSVWPLGHWQAPCTHFAPMGQVPHSPAGTRPPSSLPASSAVGVGVETTGAAQLTARTAAEEEKSRDERMEARRIGDISLSR
jgi:hypothetical protein